MMGHNHASSGVVIALAALPWAPAQGPAGTLVWVFAVAGSALIPDLDTVESSASRMWGPVSMLISRPVAWISRGHRWGTHDLVLAPAVAAVVAYATRPVGWFAGVLLAVAIGLTIRGAGLLGVGRVGWITNLVCAGVAAWWLTTHYPSGASQLCAVLVWALPLGIVAHILGDALSDGGVPVPLVWMWSPRRMVIPLFRTGRAGEAWVATPMLGVAVLLLLWWRIPLVHEWVDMATSWMTPLRGSSA